MLEITGRVVVDRSGTPVPGVVVEAFDLSRGPEGGQCACEKRRVLGDGTAQRRVPRHRAERQLRQVPPQAFKQGGGEHLVGDFTSRVISPFRKTRIERPERAHPPAYYFLLEVWDKTVLNDDTATHYAWSIWPSASRTT
jgi:hypothetical protein